MKSVHPLRAIGRWLARLAAQDDLAALRRVLFRTIVTISILACLSGILGPTSASFADEAQSSVRAFLAAWVFIQGIYLLLERHWPSAAYMAFLTSSAVVMFVIVEAVPHSARETAGVLFTYQTASIFLAVGLLRLRSFVAYSSGATAAQLVWAAMKLRDDLPQVFAGYATPLVVHWGLGLMLAWLVDTHYRRLVETRNALATHKATLEMELRRRTRIIEAQHDRVRQAEKLQAVGQLAGGIAHDFNNVLEGVLLAANTIARAPDKTDRVMKAARLIERASRRGSELTSQILNFARGVQGDRRPIAMDAAVLGVAELLQRTLDSSIILRTRLNAGPATILADPGQVQQVVMNLALNARDAMPNGGTLELITDVVRLNGAETCLTLSLEPGEYVRVIVSDEGAGIPNEVRSRMFEPFFTTKQGRRNAGMGLAIVYGIAKGLRGCVSCDSEEGKGTRFSLYLPASADDESVPQQHEASTSAPGRRYRILLVEDDADVRLMAACCLQDAGHDVVVASDGLEALSSFKESPEGFELVVLDLSMPRMGGGECLRAIRKMRPNTMFLLTTGLLVEGELAKEVEDGRLACLRKPYAGARLLSSIDEIMGVARSERPVGQLGTAQ